ncbi:MAG: hypothetical protein J4400_05720 [Candidatus Aenigmarchaeota archaeon]|nr:hypothetical protein [Candidatus Aenigmarchaeota archaeon]
MWKLLMLLLVIPLSAAEIAQYDVEFRINEDESVHHLSRFVFVSPVSDIIVTDGVQPLRFTTVATGEGYVLNIFPDVPTSQIIIEYTAYDVIFRLDSIEHFFTELNFDNSVNLSASLTLPVGYTLYDDSFKPSNAEIRSDGRRIVLYWEEDNVSNALFSVKYVPPKQEFSLWLAVVAILFSFISTSTIEERRTCFSGSGTTRK